MKSRKRLRKILGVTTAVLIVGGGCLSWYLLRGLKHQPKPANFECYNLKQGSLQAFIPEPLNIYGVGLAYSNHIIETAADYDPASAPPIFKKHLQSLHGNKPVNSPRQTDLYTAAEEFEGGLGKKLKSEFENLAVLLDYETELGFVLLEDVSLQEVKSKDFIPKLGFFAANDLSARSLAVLGEGQNNKHDYWGISKSFPGFLPVSDNVWIPSEHRKNGLPCVNLTTRVNGKVRQNESSANLIYTPRAMLRFIAAKYPKNKLKKGDLVLTGTPGGVAMATPRWLVRLGNLVGLDRFAKLKAVLGRDRAAFLKPGDIVEVKAVGIGSVTNRIVEHP